MPDTDISGSYRGGMAVETKSRSGKSTTGATREKLLRAARDGFAELGFAATRVADIAERAGTSHGSFYTYFDDKRDILLALTEETAAAMYGTAFAPLAGQPNTARDAIRSRMAAYLRAAREHGDVVRTWDQASGVHPEVEQLRSRIRTAMAAEVAELFERDREAGLVRAGVDLEIAASALTAMVEEFAKRWLHDGRAIGDHEIDQLTDLWANAVYGGQS
jgi:AcrR family transcriptional regulator